MCRRWNNRDCDQTKITDSTGNVVFFIDAVPEASEGLDGLLHELNRVVESVWNSSPKAGVVDGQSTSIEL
jgi:DNA/RNA-binding domain of Phe-tRNA-synthetase-like protein